MRDDVRLLMELLDFSVMILICIAAGILIMRSLYRKLQAEAPEKRIANLITSVICALLAGCALLWLILILSTVFRGRWCEGCQEYH